jgi:hypothetical protein
MKNTLLAVLVISLCDIQAQSIAPHSSGYVKYQEAIPNQSIEKGAKKVNPLRDGVASFDKLTNDISAFNKMADGTASSDKLAGILLNSLENFDSVSRTDKRDKPVLRIVPVVNRSLSKPRPVTSKKSGWLL